MNLFKRILKWFSKKSDKGEANKQGKDKCINNEAKYREEFWEDIRNKNHSYKKKSPIEKSEARNKYRSEMKKSFREREKEWDKPSIKREYDNSSDELLNPANPLSPLNPISPISIYNMDDSTDRDYKYDDDSNSHNHSSSDWSSSSSSSDNDNSSDWSSSSSNDSSSYDSGGSSDF